MSTSPLQLLRLRCWWTGYVLRESVRPCAGPYGIHSVAVASFTNQWLTLPQCMRPSASQMQPRSETGVESAVKHTSDVSLHGRPRSDIAPSGAVEGTEAVE